MEGNAVVLSLTAELVGWEGSKVSQVEHLSSIGYGKNHADGFDQR